MWRLTVVLSAVLIGSCFAGIVPEDVPAAGDAEQQPPVGCVVDGHFMAVGETFNTGPEPCNTYTCHAPDAVYALTCPMFTAGEGCEIVPGNQSAVYPGCCMVESCNENIINVDLYRNKGSDDQ